jgi:hypothetical protein
MPVIKGKIETKIGGIMANELLPMVRKMRSELSSWEETLEILANKDLMKRIKKSMKDVKMGRVISREELEKLWKKKHGKI